MKLSTAFILATVILASSACASAKKPKANKGESEITLLCDYTTDETAFYANAVEESTNMQMAKDKAALAARAEIAQAVKMSIETFTQQYRNDENAEAQQKTDNSMQSITVQTMSGCIIVCNRIVRTDSGKYRAYVSMKLPKDDVVNAIREALAKDDASKSLDQRQAEFEKAIQNAIIKSNK